VRRTPSIFTLIALVAVAGCTASSAEDRAAGEAARQVLATGDTLPPIEQPSSTGPVDTETKTAVGDDAVRDDAAMALVDTDGQLAVVDSGGTVSNAWIKWSALVAPDETTAVLTLPPDTVRTLSHTKVAWASLPDGEPIGDLTIEGVITEATATSLDGELVALNSLADDPVDGAIAGARDGTNLLIASRTSGLMYKTSLDGNFMAEAFSQRLTPEGIPAQVFLLEYLPADHPTYYQVRVLSTETGDISPPLNLRDKSVTLDQQMPGYSRSHVVADDHGLLFTLYIGSGGPDAPHPFAFVHTLDFADGVWCLDVDQQLDLTNEAGSLAVGGDRLYVASANGWVGSFSIPSITDPTRSPAMDWTVQVASAGSSAPAITADERGAFIAFDDGPDELIHVRPDGTTGEPIDLAGTGTQALTITDTGDVAAVGGDWTSLTGAMYRPDWLDAITRVIVATDSLP
jgi:hypothetical protein